MAAASSLAAAATNGSATLSLTACTLSNNSAESFGGGIFINICGTIDTQRDAEPERLHPLRQFCWLLRRRHRTATVALTAARR